jgi:hypothetical protein
MPRNPTIKKLRGGKKRVSFAVKMPRGAAHMLLEHPVIRRALIAERRAMLCEIVPHLKRAGFSANGIASAFGVPASALSVWLKAYAAGGIDALLLKPMGRRAPRGTQPPAFIHFTLAG